MGCSLSVLCAAAHNGGSGGPRSEDTELLGGLVIPLPTLAHWLSTASKQWAGGPQFLRKLGVGAASLDAAVLHPVGTLGSERCSWSTLRCGRY